MKSCKFAVYSKNDNLMFCKNKDNKHDHEGNCSEKICPLGEYFYQVLERSNTLHNKIERPKRTISSELENL